MQLNDNKVFIISLDIPHIQSFPTGHRLLPPKPSVWKCWVRPMTGSVVPYLAITAHLMFLSLTFNFFWSFTCGKQVAYLYLLITLKKLNGINIVFPHVSILPSQTKHQVKKAMVQSKSHVQHQVSYKPTEGAQQMLLLAKQLCIYSADYKFL